MNRIAKRPQFIDIPPKGAGSNVEASGQVGSGPGTAGFEPKVAKSSEELLSLFDQSVATGRAAIDSAKDDQMSHVWTFKMAGQTIFATPRHELIRSLINHVAHHRAQLGVYLRMNDIAVPGMYGPSADEMA